MLDERMKEVFERTENHLGSSSPDHILQEVSNKIIGKRQMNKLIEQAEAADAKLLFEQIEAQSAALRDTNIGDIIDR